MTLRKKEGTKISPVASQITRGMGRSCENSTAALKFALSILEAVFASSRPIAREGQQNCLEKAWEEKKWYICRRSARSQHLPFPRCHGPRRRPDPRVRALCLRNGDNKLKRQHELKWQGRDVPFNSLVQSMTVPVRRLWGRNQLSVLPMTFSGARPVSSELALLA